MKQDGSKRDGVEGTWESSGQQQTQGLTPDKATPMSQLLPSREPAVQRKAASPDAAPSSVDWTDDPRIDAAIENSLLCQGTARTPSTQA